MCPQMLRAQLLSKGPGACLEYRNADLSYATHSSLVTPTTLRRLVLVWAADDGATISHVPDTPFNLHVRRPNSVLVLD